MNKQQMHEAMRVSRVYSEANLAVTDCFNSLSKVRSACGWFLTNDQIEILRKADHILDELKDKTNVWAAGKYAENTITQEQSLTDSQ
jgi:hypothetical protein